MKDKQIDNIGQMARVMCGRDKDCLVCPIQSPCLMRNCAELINAEGYRKSAEVAREIFAEIEEGVKAAVSALQFENNPIHRQVKHETYSSLMRFIKTVEKKYTEVGNENTK